jgi:hypothetical protein
LKKFFSIRLMLFGKVNYNDLVLPLFSEQKVRKTIGASRGFNRRKQVSAQFIQSKPLGLEHRCRILSHKPLKE